PVKSNELVAGAAELGVLLLLFEVGLESTVAQMLEVGASSFLVASVGVIAPFALGWLASGWWHPHASTYVHVFLGATLTATSVGITARVLKDLDRSQTAEARVILGAAVIDDVMGLVILAVVIGALGAADRGGTLSYGTVAVTLLKALAFLVGSLVLGLRTAPRVFSLAAKLRAPGVLLVVGLAICFSLAWLASQLGLAPIVGAFAAGLILERVHYKDFTERGERGLEELVRPISGLLTPIFFVLMGMRTQLASFAQPGVLGLAAVLTVAAILGKQACGLGVLGRGVDRLTVGIGMIPRGEVGLIFANLGSALTLGGAAVVDHATYSAIVAMVIVTTLITPPALEWAFARKRTQPT
ncbi:MAG TPA: cation:proton antiporter, partial [Polyangiales bacterium]|nr:cation:proton antiporter [Polyangiales bacterium]